MNSGKVSVCAVLFGSTVDTCSYVSLWRNLESFSEVVDVKVISDSEFDSRLVRDTRVWVFAVVAGVFYDTDMELVTFYPCSSHLEISLLYVHQGYPAVLFCVGVSPEEYRNIQFTWR